ncbi:glyoxylate reductase (NADP(+)) [Ranunculus cassubicifolius]
MEVGFLGLGIMGKAMSMNLLRRAVDSNLLSKCDELVEHGASVGATPADVIKKCKYTIGMLSAALSVVFDKDGVLEQICEGKCYIDMSTVDADHMMNAFSEGLVLADRSGLSQQTLLDVLDLGAIANPMFKGKGPSMIKSSHPPAFPLKHQQKDMRLALALGDENAVSMPVAAAANEAFKKARSLGLGDNDFSAVYEVLKVREPSS